MFNNSGGTNPLDRQGGAPQGIMNGQGAPGGMGGGMPGMGGGGMPQVPPNMQNMMNGMNPAMMN